MSAKYVRQIFVLLMITGFFTGITHPCGPFLPNRVLEEGDDYVLKPPEGFFSNEIENISQSLDSYLNETNSDYKALLKYKAKRFLKTENIDLSDLKEALEALKIDKSKSQSILEQYEKTRKVITDIRQARSDWQWRQSERSRGSNMKETEPPKFIPPEIPAGIPEEFKDYLTGAIYYYQDQFDKATSTWEKLLKRPASQRKYKSTWAAYMIGRVLLSSKPQDSIKWFALTRELAGKGFADNLALAAASIGQQALAELNQGNYSQAIELYMIQLATGDYSAEPSLQTVCFKILDADAESQKKAANNKLSREVVSAYILSRGGFFQKVPSSSSQIKWLNAIDQAKVSNVDEAGRFAWISYSMGDTTTAAIWVAKASQNDVMAQWIEAKLLLQQGKIADATKQLVRISRFVAPDGELNGYERYGYGNNSNNYVMKTIRGELGTLYISQKYYIEALDSLIRGGYWEDAAYIAERILTIDELKNYIDKNWPKAGKDDSTYSMPAQDRLRYLFARRLARLDKWKEARQYYPLKWQSHIDAYAKTLQDSKNLKLGKAKRAAALWKAAVIARYEGMELMGTELEMDWFIYNGSSYHRKPMPDVRKTLLSEEIVPSSSDELKRTKQTIPSDKKFHYRYIATEFAWQAAELMPDNSDQTARVLCIAGSWIMTNDAQAADKFYKALVKRNRKTSLGQEADKLRWFPKIEFEAKTLLNEVNQGL